MRIWKKPEGFGTPVASEGERIDLTCKFLTPVFGGGHEPKKPDALTPVRVPSLRGQLRFWWRATHAELDLATLRALETAVFGGVHSGAPVESAVAISVVAQPRSAKKIEVFQQGDAFKPHGDTPPGLAYGAFPLRGLDAAKRHDFLYEYNDPFVVRLVLRRDLLSGLTDAKQRASLARVIECVRNDTGNTVTLRGEVERALWAFLHFGGLGGRTRRGFGAIELVDGRDFRLVSIEDGWPGGRGGEVVWPVLPRRATVVRSPIEFKVGRKAQEYLLDQLFKMRQGNLGRKHEVGRPRPGRSFWPEPSAIRHSTHLESGPHGSPIPDPRVDAFPRAAFGAPIIFHFKTEPGGAREPADSTLLPTRVGAKGQPEPLGRLASPLVLRPHAWGGKIRAMALRLDHPAPSGWALVGRRNKPTDVPDSVSVSVTPEQAARIRPLVVDGTPTTDPIEAYFRRLEKP